MLVGGRLARVDWIGTDERTQNRLGSPYRPLLTFRRGLPVINGKEEKIRRRRTNEEKQGLMVYFLEVSPKRCSGLSLLRRSFPRFPGLAPSSVPFVSLLFSRRVTLVLSVVGSPDLYRSRGRFLYYCLRCSARPGCPTSTWFSGPFQTSPCPDPNARDL